MSMKNLYSDFKAVDSTLDGDITYPLHPHFLGHGHFRHALLIPSLPACFAS